MEPKADRKIFWLLITLICIIFCSGQQIEYQSYQTTLGASQSVIFYANSGDIMKFTITFDRPINLFKVFQIDASKSNFPGVFSVQTVYNFALEYSSLVQKQGITLTQGSKMIYSKLQDTSDDIYVMGIYIVLNDETIVKKNYATITSDTDNKLVVPIYSSKACQGTFQWSGPLSTISMIPPDDNLLNAASSVINTKTYTFSLDSPGLWYILVQHNFGSGFKNTDIKITTSKSNQCANPCFSQNSALQLQRGKTESQFCMCNPSGGKFYNMLTGLCTCNDLSCSQDSILPVPDPKPVASCGNKQKEDGEQCDNGNKAGCIDCRIQTGFTCKQNPYSSSLCYENCGDGILSLTEKCDNGNKAGCSDCQVSLGYSCTGVIGSSSDCQIKCGDEILGGNQKCDNGNKPGCSKNCVPDAGYTCKGRFGSKSVCTSFCGDSIKTADQICDNGKKSGCTTCKVVDPGYYCTGADGGISVCSGICGDSIRVSTQVCDNGNKAGCSTSCKLDTGYTCTGAFGSISTCSTVCGDYIKIGAEQCDNGDRTGCKGCVKDPLYTCTQSGLKSVCTKI